MGEGEARVRRRSAVAFLPRPGLPLVSARKRTGTLNSNQGRGGGAGLPLPAPWWWAPPRCGLQAGGPTRAWGERVRLRGEDAVREQLKMSNRRRRGQARCRGGSGERACVCLGLGSSNSLFAAGWQLGLG